ncbi:unnamed protein product [Meganyctiphanes norvegica]|uniref:Uncharacterized protein n=1 Tax=Meganyctiphanes norvegica TaxID=48144 RepID=A0AAV2PV11_MEGNR
MVGRRLPERLESRALTSWLRVLETQARRGEGVRAPLLAPPALLLAALDRGTAGLREVVVARLAVAAVEAGVSKLEVNLEHPTLIEAVLHALAGRPHLTQSLNLKMGPRTAVGDLLSDTLKGMVALTSLTLTPAATDDHLVALAAAKPPLQTLDVSYCTEITDKGIWALIGEGDDATIMRDVMKGVTPNIQTNPGKKLAGVNLWGTGVTTRGCVLLMALCPVLAVLTCRWATEALELLVRCKRSAALSITQLLVAEAPSPNLQQIVPICPHLTSLVVRHPPEFLNPADILVATPNLSTLSLLQFTPTPDPWLPTTPINALTSLHLSLLCPRDVNLMTVSTSFPSLQHLTLEGIHPVLPNPQTPVPSSSLETLRMVAPPLSRHNLNANVIVWVLEWAKSCVTVDIGYCNLLTDKDLAEVLSRSALAQVIDLRLSGASKLSNESVWTLLDSCPDLRRLALKMLPMERLAALESLKVQLRMDNIDVELITYGWKF